MKISRTAPFLVFILLQVALTNFADADMSTSGYWVGIFPTYSFSKKHSVTLQAEARRQGDNSFVLLRPSYHYQLEPWVNVGLGADLFTTERTEARLWAEFNLKAPEELLWQKFHLRYRQEFRELSSVESSGARSRVMLMSQISISEAKGLEVFVFDEVFYSQRTFSGLQNSYDRNWLGFRLRKNQGKVFYDLGGFWEKVFDERKSEGFVGIFSVGGFF